MSIEYMAGLIVGIFVAVLVLWLIGRKAKSKGPAQFDERQQVARARAYSVGFFTILFYCVLYALVSAVGVKWCQDAVGMVLGCFVGITAFVISAIRHDAYFGINEDVKTMMRLGIVIVFFCYLGGFIQRFEGEMVEDGLLTGNVMSLAVGTMWLVIIAAYKLHSKKTGEEEEADNAEEDE